MRSILLVLLLALTPLAAAVVTSPPAPSVGDHWDIRASVPTMGSIPASNRTTRLTVDAMETLDGAATARLVSNETGPGRPPAPVTETTTTLWQRIADGATMKTHTLTRTTYSGSSPPPPRDATTIVTYAPPCDALQFPLTIGKAWNVHCVATRIATAGGATTTTTENQDVTFEVIAEESLNVTAGTFDTVRLHVNARGENGNSSSVQWYAPRACTLVKSATTFDANGRLLTVTNELVSFRCVNGEKADAATREAPDAKSPIPLLAPLAWVGVAAAVALALRRR